MDRQLAAFDAIAAQRCAHAGPAHDTATARPLAENRVAFLGAYLDQLAQEVGCRGRGLRAGLPWKRLAA